MTYVPPGSGAANPDFIRTWNGMTLDQRIAWLRYVGTPWEEDNVVRDWVRTQYGAMGAYLDHPEIGPILLRSAKEGWSPERLQATIGQTTFWKTTTDAQRQYDLLEKSDPATAAKSVDQMAVQINTLLAQEGATGQLTEARVRELATQLIRNGAPQDQVPTAVLAEVSFVSSPMQPVGRLGTRMSEVKSKADQYLIPVSDQAAFDWAKQIETGQSGVEAFDEYAKQIAKAQYGWMAERIDAGSTVRMIADPIIQTLSQEWGVSGASLTAQDLAPTLAYDDGNTTRVMNMSDAVKYARQDDRYWVDNAKGEAEAARFVQQLASQFGKA